MKQRDRCLRLLLTPPNPPGSGPRAQPTSSHLLPQRSVFTRQRERLWGRAGDAQEEQPLPPPTRLVGEHERPRARRRGRLVLRGMGEGPRDG